MKPWDLRDELVLETGGFRDYHALSEFHYKSNRPITFKRIFALRDRRPSVSGRYLSCNGEARTVGVLVESLPALSCKLRDWALRDRYRKWVDARDRAVLLNAEVRCISRVIVHPQWRGVGLAVRLVGCSLDHPETRYTEALAAMGRVHPFFSLAGMVEYRRPPHRYDDRLKQALEFVGIEPVGLADVGSSLRKIRSLSVQQQDWLYRELLIWGRFVHGRSHKDIASWPCLLRLVCMRLQSEPVYYLKDHDRVDG
jgi:hypothetical protein